MSLPINGRIAIIDDQISQAEPLMKIFSQRQIPFTYFSGEYNFLPETDKSSNDIRMLFLDINLIDNAERTDKALRAKLIPVLSRVISENNYPYVIIYWSRHEHHRKLIEGIFDINLPTRKPIAFQSAMKSDFFNLDGTPSEDFDTKIADLFEKITMLIEASPAYNYLLSWENRVHMSADKTLEEIFSAHNKFENWLENANYIFNKLGSSYSGQKFNEQDIEGKIKSTYKALNVVFTDTLESGINSLIFENPTEIKLIKDFKSLESLNNINKKLLISDELEPIHYSGTVIELKNKKSDADFEYLLNNILSDKGKVDKAEIMVSWKKVWVNVTPLCDTAQGKVVFHRLVRGVLVTPDTFNSKDIRKDIRKAFHSNEAIYISPTFTFKNKEYCMVIDFRHFFAMNEIKKSKNLKPIFRIRQQLLSEIQSRLARHVNRQGVLFLDKS